MLHSKSAKHLRRYEAFGALFLAILIFVALLMLHHRDQSIDASHDHSATLPVAAHMNQNNPIAVSRTPVAEMPHPGPNIGIGENQNVTKSRFLSRDHRDAVFTGNWSISTARLKELARSLKNVSPDESSKELINKINEAYRAFGFWRANTIVESDPSDPTRILINIDEGKQYRWGDVEITSEKLPQNTIAALFHVEKGWPANMVEMRNMLHAYVADFQEQGYMDCSITPQLSTDDASGQVSLKVDISEGPRYTVGYISLDSPEAQSIFSKLQGQVFNPSLYESLLAQTGLTEDDIRLEFNATRGEVSLVGSAPRH